MSLSCEKPAVRRRGPAQAAEVSLAEGRRRERRHRLLAWLVRDLGEAWGRMPAYPKIGARLRIQRLDHVSETVRTAQAIGLIAIDASRGTARRSVRVLPAGIRLAGGDGPAGDAAETFEVWLSRALPGERRGYFLGHLAEARQKAVLFGCDAAIAAALREAADAARAADLGLVTLTARRVGEQFEYLATRCRVRVGA